MPDTSLVQQLHRQAASLGVDDAIDSRVEAALERYLALLLQWNERINLTAVREPSAIIEKHFVDSLALLPHLSPGAKTMIDVGSGPGFPGAVIALVRPSLAVTLVESNHKKAAFLSMLRRELPLPNVTVVAERIEAFAASPTFCRVDVAVSRATIDLPTWLSLGHSLVTSPGGIVLGMEGSDVRDLPPGAVRHAYRLGNARRSIIVDRVG